MAFKFKVNDLVQIDPSRTQRRWNVSGVPGCTYKVTRVSGPDIEVQLVKVPNPPAFYTDAWFRSVGVATNRNIHGWMGHGFSVIASCYNLAQTPSKIGNIIKDDL